jgi:hypothetical protein
MPGRRRSGCQTCPHVSQRQYVEVVTFWLVAVTWLDRQKGHCDGWLIGRSDT